MFRVRGREAEEAFLQEGFWAETGLHRMMR